MGTPDNTRADLKNLEKAINDARKRLSDEAFIAYLEDLSDLIEKYYEEINT